MTNTKRDARSMNRMDPDTKWVHTRLEEWGRYAKDPGIAGYPRESVTERAAKYGELGIPQDASRKPEQDMPESVAYVDAAVSRLGQIDQRVIKAYYTEWEAAEVLAKLCQMRLRQFQNVLKRSRWRVAGYLDAIESAAAIRGVSSVSASTTPARSRTAA